MIAVAVTGLLAMVANSVKASGDARRQRREQRFSAYVSCLSTTDQLIRGMRLTWSDVIDAEDVETAQQANVEMDESLESDMRQALTGVQLVAWRGGKGAATALHDRAFDLIHLSAGEVTAESLGKRGKAYADARDLYLRRARADLKAWKVWR